MYENLLVGIVSGLIASSCFLLFLYRLRPQIEISPHIAKLLRPDRTIEYGFKFLNKTAYPIIEVKTLVRVRTPENVADGKIFATKKLLEGILWEVPRYDKKDIDCCYAQRFYKVYDLEAEWDDSVSELEFLVMAKHQLSGFTTVTKHTWYKKKNSIVEGSHKYGINLSVA